MSNVQSAVMIEWGMPIEGREMKALEEFMVAVNWWTEAKTKGRIADFRIYGNTTGNIQHRAGVLIAEGSEKQIQELTASDDFRTRIQRVCTIGQNATVTELETGDAMTTRMQRYGKTVKDMLG